MKNKMAYTPATGKSMVVMIEAVFPIDEDNILETVEDSLDVLRGIGFAEIVGKELIEEDFDEASSILHSRKLDI